MENIRLPKTFNLHIGCGTDKQDGFIGLDKRPHKNVDIVHNLEEIPWPLPDSSVAILLASHILEHIDPRLFIEVMDEIWRVMIPDGSLMISAPYVGSLGGYQDPTHMRPGFVEESWGYFHYTNYLWNIYKPKPFSVEHCIFDPSKNIEVRMRPLKVGSRNITKKELKRYGVR